ncbi:hypothetical protein P8452_78067 [Trifolium repens]|nr:hypothetical protein P8452_78067 [Trifolium repens]
MMTWHVTKGCYGWSNCFAGGQIAEHIGRKGYIINITINDNNKTKRKKKFCISMSFPAKISPEKMTGGGGGVVYREKNTVEVEESRRNLEIHGGPEEHEEHGAD